MAEHQARRNLKGRLLKSLSVLVVCIIVGVLIALNVSMNRSSLTAGDTASLLTQRDQQVEDLRNSNAQLLAQINKLTNEKRAANALPADTTTIEPAMQGPGLTVTLTDSPLWQDTQGAGLNGDTNVNDYVVHEQDLEGVINALWAGGAEVMMIQDQRVLPTTAVRCIGNVLLLEGKQYAPPYVISAIGDVEGMQRSLDESNSVNTYKQYVDSIGLGWDMKVSDNLKFPAAPANIQSLKYAIPSSADTSGVE
jgi:uncharacterized protein YlxW (UPF0749 family)